MTSEAKTTISSTIERATALATVRGWLQPVSKDRELAFRERVIRTTLAIVTFFALISLLLNRIAFNAPITLVSYFTLHIVALAGCFIAAALVSRQQILYAGWTLTLTVLLGASGIILLARTDGAAITLINAIPTLMFVPLVATLVLPRNLILPLAVLTVAFYILTQFVLPVGDFEILQVGAEQQIIVALAVLVLEAVLLRQLRVEFDARLEAMEQSIRQTEAAKQEAEAARQRAELDRERAEEADRTKSQFLANMSHELRTPLNAIIGYDEAMLGGMAGSFSEKQTDLLTRIQLNGHRLLGLINDVLDLSKIESGSLEIFLAPMSPQKTIVDSVESLRSLATQKSLNLVTEMSDTVPQLILGDANKLQQIIVNLLSNAIKFTPAGSVTVHVQSVSDARWQFKVSDTGIGITESDLPRLFEPFHQGNASVDHKVKGTGLGLAITKRLVEKMGGTIAVETQVGKGTTFTVTLPRTNLPEPNVSINKT